MNPAELVITGQISVFCDDYYSLTCTLYTRHVSYVSQLGSPQQKPKHVKLLCDVSGSMYRFDGADGRLERQLESMLLIMEALEGYSHKVKVSSRSQLSANV